MLDDVETGRITDFLAQKRIAVIGVGHTGENTGTAIFRRFRDAGYNVFGVNPHGGTVDAAPLFAHAADIPGGVEAAVLVTHPSAALDAVKDCQAAGVSRVWMHDNKVLPGSASADAVDYARAQGLTVISEGCPMMHLQPDVGHRCMHWVLCKTGMLPA
jgi:predicted CoA-binding protein